MEKSKIVNIFNKLRNDSSIWVCPNMCSEKYCTNCIYSLLDIECVICKKLSRKENKNARKQRKEGTKSWKKQSKM